MVHLRVLQRKRSDFKGELQEKIRRTSSPRRRSLTVTSMQCRSLLSSWFLFASAPPAQDVDAGVAAEGLKQGEVDLQGHVVLVVHRQHAQNHTV